jgi:hypothetical protein
MARMQVDAALKEALSKNGRQVELCDASGEIVGYAISTAEMRRIESTRKSMADLYAQADASFDAEEYRRALADPRRYSTEEVIKMLGLE